MHFTVQCCGWVVPGNCLRLKNIITRSKNILIIPDSGMVGYQQHFTVKAPDPINDSNIQSLPHQIDYPLEPLIFLSYLRTK